MASNYVNCRNVTQIIITTDGALSEQNHRELQQIILCQFTQMENYYKKIIIGRIANGIKNIAYI